MAEILAGHEVRFVRTLADARRALAAERFDLVAIGVHFDESRMFDLLRHLQAHSQPPGAVVCMRTHHFASPAISIEGLDIAARTLGSNLFVDLTWYPDDATGNGAVRRLLEALVNP